MVYLDYQATTPIDQRVIEMMMPYFTKYFGNPHSNEHVAGWSASKAVDIARLQIATFLHADEDEIIFTSGATESNNLAILGTIRKSGCNHLVVSEVEHKSTLECASYLANEGISVSFLPVNQRGEISTDQLMQSIQDKVALVSIIGVNNEIGTIQDLKTIAQIVHENGGLLHIDAAQLPITQDINVLDIGIDLLSLSSHKVYGPKGVGALFIRRDIQKLVAPIFHGGGQEGGLRPGTLPVALIVGFGEALLIMGEEGAKDRDRMRHLTRLLFNKLSQGVPGIHLNGAPLESRHPGNLNIQFPDINAKTLLHTLQPAIAASTGSACSSGTPEPSYVLRSIGLSKQEAEASIRFSLGRFTTESEINQAASLIIQKAQLLIDLT